MLTPFVGLALFGRVLYPRFIFLWSCSSSAFGITLGSAYERVKQVSSGIYCVSLYSAVLYMDYFIFFSYTAPIPKSDETVYR